jgi:hypothetical protein
MEERVATASPNHLRKLFVGAAASRLFIAELGADRLLPEALLLLGMNCVAGRRAAVGGPGHTVAFVVAL